MSSRNRERRPARRPIHREPRHRILVVTEGRVTEPEYLLAFRDGCRNPRVEVHIPNEHGIPLTLVELAVALKADAEKRARAERDDNLAFDEVWCVHDVDEHPKLNDARQLATANDIHLAVSNPCFELWVLLHFRESPGARHRHDLQRMVGQYLQDYHKHLDPGVVLPLYEKALGRATRLDRIANEMGEPGHNPTTGVYQLTESIRRGGQDPPG